MHGETLHSTLVFIGNIDKSMLESLHLAGLEVSGQLFELCLDVARYWGHNHIVYAAPSHLPLPLVQLAQSLQQSLARHGFKFDHREFRPHVTLIRNARWNEAPLPEMRPVCWQIRDFVLVQSLSHQGRVAYRVLDRFPLGPNTTVDLCDTFS